MAYAAGGTGFSGVYTSVGIILVLYILLVIISKPWF